MRSKSYLPILDDGNEDASQSYVHGRLRLVRPRRMWYFRLAKLLPSINPARKARLADVRGAYSVASIRVRENWTLIPGHVER